MAELYFKKQLEIDKALAKPNLSSIGDTQHSILTEAQFQAERDSTWVLMDGRSIAGSDLATVTGLSSLPDARGVSLRGKNNGRADGNENPDGDLAIGTFQGDAYTDHQHQGTNDVGGVAWGQGSVFIAGRGVYGSGSGGTTDLTSPASIIAGQTTSSETRPKSITTNIFIKINR